MVTISLKPGNDTYAGTATADSINGLAGNDTLLGGAGNDSIDGGVGDDGLWGGVGADTLWGGQGSDYLYGGSGNDLLNGGAGRDVLNGGPGDDSYKVDDSVDEILDSGGDDTVISTIDYTLPVELEQLILKGIAFNGVGNGLDNRLTGNEAANRLYGDTGNDTLLGMGGDDVLEGGRGEDTIRYLGTRGDYEIIQDRDNESWTIKDLRGTKGDGVDEGTDRLMDIESVLFADNETLLFGQTKGQAVIDLGKDYGKLINPVTVDGGRVYYYWDRSGDGTKANTQGAGYANSSDYVTHDWLDKLFRQDVNGQTGGGGDTDNTYRYATINGVKLALPTVGNGDDFIGSGEYGYRNGTAVQGTANNPTYDDYLAIWDAYNGTGTGTNIDGTPPGWVDGSYYWSATPVASGHANLGLDSGDVDATYYDYHISYVAVEVL